MTCPKPQSKIQIGNSDFVKRNKWLLVSDTAALSTMSNHLDPIFFNQRHVIPEDARIMGKSYRSIYGTVML